MFDKIKNIFQANKPDMQEHSMIKSAYYSDYYNIISGSNPSKLIISKGIESIDDMLYDEQVKACLAVKNYAILSTGYHIEPAQKLPKSKADLHADFITDNFNDWLRGSLVKMLEELMTFISYGFVVGEQNYATDGKFIYLDNVKVRHPNTFKIYPDEYGNIGVNSIKQWQSSGEVVMPNNNNKFIHYAYRAKFGNPYGRSDLEEAYRDWFIKNTLVKMEAIYLEKFGTPSILAKFSGTKDQRDALIKMFQKLRGAGVGTVPKDVEYEIINAVSGGGVHYRRALEAKDKAIAKALLMPDQLGFTGGSSEGGSYAKSQTHFDVFLWVIDGIRQEIEDTIVSEQIIKPLIDYNFGEQEEYPKFKFNDFDDQNKTEIYKIWLEAIKGQAVKATKKDEDHLRKMLEFPDREESDELLNEMPEENYEENEEDIENDEIVGKQDGTGNSNKDEKDGVPLDGTKPGEGKGNEEIANMEASKYPKTANMERVNFEKINDIFKDETEKTYIELDDTIEKMAIEAIDRIENKKIITKKRFDEIDKFQLKYVGDIKLIYKKLFSKVYKQGIALWKEELQKKEFQDLSEIMPDEYLAWLNSKAFMEAGKLADEYKIMVKQTLIVGIENGYTQKKILEQLYQAFSRVEVVGATTKPTFTEGRLKTIIRTNTNASFNKGRYIQNLELSETSKNPIYRLFSEVLEGRTTESHPISAAIHGKYVLQGTEISQKLQYPLHYNDRGVEITVIGNIQEVPKDKIITSIADIPGITDMNGLLIDIT